jgi:hypothetical protein
VLAQQLDRRERLKRRHVAGAGHHDVRVAAVRIVGGPFPDPDTHIAVLHRLVHGQPLRRRLLARHDDVDAVVGAQAVIDDPQQAIGVGRQIDPHDVRLLIHDHFDEARILVTEPVVVLPPDVRGEKIMRDAMGWRQERARETFSHLACWLNIESTMCTKAS